MPDPAAPSPAEQPVASKREKEQLWLEENRAAMDAYNAWIDEHGLPLAAYRQF